MDLKIKPGQMIEYLHKDTKFPVTAKVIGRAGKAKGPLKNWYNIPCFSPEELAGMEMSIICP